MAKVKIHTDELYEDTSTHDVYRRLLDGTYELVKVSGAALVTTYVPGIFTPFENDTAPTAAVEKLSIGDALELRIGLSNNDVDGTETVPATKNLFVSFNHASVLELDTPATRICIPYGKTATFAFSSTAPLTQFCYKIDAAPGAGAAVKISGGYTI